MTSFKVFITVVCISIGVLSATATIDISTTHAVEMKVDQRELDPSFP
ncbi:hypothetical protein [Mechercharimyces sp. CAU 1602]|nr:hypothetical protein [Mechercharimyces sp. CAU 1602]MCS1351215.1 hypothetical protein [Mechercharimyces sp. CAU 1602]